MAQNDRILALLNAHYQDDKEGFNTVALQIAAAEARAGHTVAAQEIRKIVDKNRSTGKVLRMSFMNTALSDSVVEELNLYTLDDLVVADDIRVRIERTILEYQERELLERNGLQNRSRLLFGGPSGTGKTMTASVIANETGLPLYVVQLEKIVSRFLGSTSAKLAELFEIIATHPGVYLFDEFDAIGTERERDNEVGEMRRILNSFLKLTEQPLKRSIVIAATNDMKVLDKALFRRFDDVVQFTLPTHAEIVVLLQKKLEKRISAKTIANLTSALEGYSQAVICAVCDDALKTSILTNKPLSKQMLVDSLNQRIANVETRVG
jgi:SpoVK/Ycf46/Vps4 family AAA+-type ATPase